MADIVTISTTEYTVTIQQGDTQTVVVTPAPEQVVTISTEQGLAPYTDADARQAISVSGAGLSYNNTTGIVTYTQQLVPIDKGGTGSTTAGDARTALGADDASNLTTGNLLPARVSTIPINSFSDVSITKTADNIVYTDGSNVRARAASNWNLTDFTNDLTSGDLPAHTHAATDVTSGTFADARIPNLDTSKITTGTFADARISESSVTQHEAALAIAASQLTSGSLSIDLIPSADLTYSIGNENFRWADIHGDIDGAVTFRAKNDSGGVLTVGDIVYIKGVSGSTPTVDLADCSNAAKMPAFGMVKDASVNNGAETHIVTLGSVESVDVPSGTYTLGSNVYVGTAGTFTDSPPTGEGNLIQNIGWVARVNTGGGPSGIIKVGGAGRTNAVPNLNSGNIFYGNGSNQATSVALTSVAAAAGHTHALGDLSDVDTAGATTGQVLEFDGADWVPATPSAGAAALNDLTDVSTAGATTGDVIVYNGSTWEPAAQSGGGEIVSDAEGGYGENSVTNIIAITQAEYDTLTPQADTFYIITDATAGTDYTNDPTATTVRQFDDLVFHGVTSTTITLQTSLGTFGTSGWSWRSDYSTTQYDYQNDDAIGVMWAAEAGAFDRGTFYGPPSILRASPSDGDKCLFECRVKFIFNASATNSYISVGFASTESGNNHQNTFMTPIYGGASRAGVYFRAGQTYLRSFVYDNWGVADVSITADITSVSNTNDTWYRIGAVCTYDAANTRWVVDSYVDGTLVATQYLTTWGPPPSYGIACYNNGDAVTNIYAVDWVSAEYVRYQNPTLLHIEDV